MAKGTFEGEVEVRWLRHAGADRHMELLTDFAFVDPSGKRWVAPAGARVDGASIPRFLWSSVGDPFIGDYRRATVLHDVECVRKTSTHESVHRMFYDAMVADGVGHGTAVRFYTAVRLFGPKWRVRTAARGGAGLGIRGRTGAAPAIPPETTPSIDQAQAALDAVLDESTDAPPPRRAGKTMSLKKAAKRRPRRRGG